MGDNYYVGLSTSGHDPAIAIADPSGKIIFAEATERFLQQKRAWGMDADHPEYIRAVLSEYLDNNSNLRLSRSWARSKSGLPIDFSAGLFREAASLAWLSGLQDRAFSMAGHNLKHYAGLGADQPVDSFDHHLCHAVNACYQSSQDAGLCLVIDGEGEVGAASLYRIRDRKLSRIWRSWGPGSLGNFYTWLTQACGFDWRRGEEWKVMGLAAYGSPKEHIVELLKKAVQVKSGRLLLPHETVLSEVIAQTKSLSRKPGDNMMAAADLAASGQAVYAYFVDQILQHCEEYGESTLILTGGCALNSSYNGSVPGRFSFLDIHVPSAPADDGNAIGAAILSWMKTMKTEEIPYADGSPYLGKNIACNDRTLDTMVKSGSFRITDTGTQSATVVGGMLADGKIVGVMRGAAEFGPRALGNRSILADPTRPGMKDFINKAVKGREPYRPFAPIVFERDVDLYFQKAIRSPYMSFTLPWKPSMAKRVPATVHADGTGRLQTISRRTNPWLSDLLTEFEKRKGVPVVLNTSFNVMGKPIVDTLEDALVVLATTGLDAVLYDTVLIEK